MEEIEILPRDGYLHTVHITRVPCSIQWWFSTKRKNIDFGLFRRISSSAAGSDDAPLQSSPAGSVGPAGSRSSTMNTLTGKRQVLSAGITQNHSDAEPRAATLQQTQQQQRNIHFKLQDKSIVELMALKHYESSKATIKGSWTAVDPGVYILYFDNSFSKNTSKRLSFCVAVRETKDETASASIKPRTLISGWLLKKKRKRMQGWASRWFTIQGRWLLYSTTEGGIPRAKVDLVSAVVSMSKEDCFITIDGDEGFFQLHAQKPQDFSAWVAALKKTKEDAAALAASANYADGATFMSGIIPHNPAAPGMPSSRSSYNHSSISPEDAMLAHAKFLESTDKLNQLINNLRLSSGGDSIQTALEYIKAIKDSEDTIYCLVGSSEKPGRPSISRWDTGASDPPSLALSASRASWFSGSGSEVFYDTNDVLEVSRDESERLLPLSSKDSYPAAGATANVTSSSSSNRSTPSIDTSQAGRGVGASMRAGDAYSTSDSDAAVDGFFDDAQEIGDDRQSARMRQDLIRDPDFMAALARNTIQHPHTAGGEIKPATSGADTAEEEGKPVKGGSSGAKQAMHKDLDKHPLVTLESMRPMFDDYEPRTSLPAESSEVNVSLISILRKNVGKDLTSIAMPLIMNEPVNALQGLCEELMYNRLLQKADEMNDSLDRLMYVAAFAISTLSSKKHRAERKPFNPLLGETYEMVDPRSGYRFVSEKVSHHPPVMACFADSPSYRFWQDSSGKSKFWGKSMEFIQTSNVHIELLKHRDHFTYCKPSALVRGLITGNRTVDFTGEMTITNHSTGDQCTVNFKEAGMFSSSNDMVECYLYRGSTGDSKVERVLRGSWSSHLRFEKSPTQAETLWTAVSLPPDSENYYRFSYFTMRLNELVPGTLQDLPHTDTRFRPDQRAYEEGRIDDAEETKHELEEAQRERKRDRDAAGVEWVPQWFEEREDPHCESGRSWQYRGGYWDARANHDFPKAVELWKTS
ncbi:Oxysterol-binding protein 3 [Coemansia sp. RSA 1813]|nr:Oxysterol-binding protein 3 [Coemansia sp. RSA 1646]KAJ1769602.1 Oxysterol-binding protein 3 [Coemansia sp. RSA 1843]KAJ2213546.1 Oxysterol-binding protein 3 [Coemansia sp. RSA 487]KAJ2568967.1 Oxysterol-binding protein 3 [Coemansia sp. RSA 1813]